MPVCEQHFPGILSATRFFVRSQKRGQVSSHRPSLLLAGVPSNRVHSCRMQRDPLILYRPVDSAWLWIKRHAFASDNLTYTQSHQIARCLLTQVAPSCVSIGHIHSFLYPRNRTGPERVATFLSFRSLLPSN